MRRHALIIILLLAGSLGLASAQGQDPPAPEPIRAPDEDVSVFGPLRGTWSAVPVELEETPPPQFTQDHGADLCSDAPRLGLTTFGTAGDETNVNAMTTSGSDPILACMWGNPSSLQGYRTVWYKFRAPVSGRLIVSTGFDPSDYGDSYDTVLALYDSEDGTCDTLTQLACDDDSNGVFSELDRFVIENRTYYIEVADWSFSAQGASTLRLSVILEEGESFWERLQTGWPTPRSRHMVVSDGRYLYVLGGETVAGTDAQRTDKFERYDPLTDTWTELADFLGEPYSRTSAAYLNGRIYIPSGYAGHPPQDPQQYAGTHLVYDVAANAWDIETAAPWSTASPTGLPYAWHQAVPVPASNRYFLTGGLLSGDPDPTADPWDGQPTGRLLIFDADGGNWITNQPNMSEARYAHTAGLLHAQGDSLVCVTGGLGRNAEGNPVVQPSTECYSGGSWSDAAPLNFPRFSAGSAVGPDGRWYVFGGVDNTLNPVSTTEVYDPASDTWEVLDSRYSLRQPGRSWPRGAFAGSTLWVLGGELIENNEIVPLVENLVVPTINTWLPAQFRTDFGSVEPNDTFSQAQPIAIDQSVAQNFAGQEDFFDVYRLQVAESAAYTIELTDIPQGSNYDIYLLNSNKFTIETGTNVGSLDERFTQGLGPGTYYAMVLRAAGQPTDSTYNFVVRR